MGVVDDGSGDVHPRRPRRPQRQPARRRDRRPATFDHRHSRINDDDSPSGELDDHGGHRVGVRRSIFNRYISTSDGVGRCWQHVPVVGVNRRATFGGDAQPYAITAGADRASYPFGAIVAAITRPDDDVDGVRHATVVGSTHVAARNAVVDDGGAPLDDRPVRRDALRRLLLLRVPLATVRGGVPASAPSYDDEHDPLSRRLMTAHATAGLVLSLAGAAFLFALGLVLVMLRWGHSDNRATHYHSRHPRNTDRQKRIKVLHRNIRRRDQKWPQKWRR